MSRLRDTHQRFTPTGVGTMLRRRAARNYSPVHPHGRGDNSDAQRPRCTRAGSPPRAWGQCAAAAALDPLHRFTPTGVGTMSGRASQSTLRAVHPHGRGDNPPVRALRSAPRGSPPRAWGQSDATRAPAQRRRFTPTGVGTIACATVCRDHRTVHPHGRGDNRIEGIRR